MNNFQTTWEDETSNRNIQFSINYMIEGSEVQIANVTPTAVAFLNESKEVERTIGVHTDKGQTMLTEQFKNAGQLDIAINKIAEEEGLLIVA